MIAVSARLASAVLIVVALVLAASPTRATPTPDGPVGTTATAVTPRSICEGPVVFGRHLGGRYVCEYGVEVVVYVGFRFEVFVVGADYSVWHRWEQSADGRLSDWHSLGGHADRVPCGNCLLGYTVLHREDLRLYVRGTDDHRYFLDRISGDWRHPWRRG
jgi:hypothetical protein